MSERSYHVYVIEAVEHGRAIFYVGQSAKTPEKRFEEQKGCKRFCSSCRCRHYVPGRALRLRYDLFATYNPMRSRREAEEVERWLARHLRKRGYRVAGGH